jgi:ferrous iron transport protein A
MAERSAGPQANSPPTAAESQAVPLTKVEAGRHVVLCRVEGGRGLLLRLAEMGIRPGARFAVLSKGRPGPYIISFGTTRLVIGRGMVGRMFVRIV